MKAETIVEDAIQAATAAVMTENPDTFEERLSLFARLENIRRELDDKLKAVKLRVETMAPDLLKEMNAQGMKSANVHGLSVHQRTDLVVNKLATQDGVTTQMVCDALTAIGRDDMVNDGYSGASLKSLIREMYAEADEAGDVADPAFEGVEEISPADFAVPDQLARLLYVERVATLTTRMT